MKFSKLVEPKDIDLASLEETILNSIFDEMGYNAKEATQWMILHCVKYEGVEYIVVPREGDLFVDICNRDDESRIETGPLAGHSISFPQPESY